MVHLYYQRRKKRTLNLTLQTPNKVICDESAQAIIEALKKTNQRMYPFVAESHDLAFQYEDNEELIRMIEMELSAQPD